MNKPLRLTTCILLLVVSTLVGLFLNIYLFMAIYRAAAYGESMKLRKYVCDIPEISSGYAPQGIGYSSEQDMYIATGYAKDNESVLYLIKDNKPTRVLLADENGEVLKGHAGGVACAKDFVYVANGTSLQIYSLSSLVSANGERVKSIGKKPVVNTAAYVFVDEDENNIYVGEFYRPGNYETDKSHYYTTPSGAENKAIASCYPLNADGSCSVYPTRIISLPGLVQGMAVKNGKFILSRSYGLVDSKLEYYREKTYAQKTIFLTFPSAPELGETMVELFYLDDTTLEKRIKLPAFSEDLTIAGDRVVVTNESACNKYIVGKLFGGGKVYSYPIDF